MEKFVTLTSTVVPLPIENVDTDQIIPARFLKATTREGFGDNLFRDWRYDKENNPVPSFVLNQNTIPVRYWWQVKTLVVVQAANTQPGLLPDTDFVWL